MVTSFLSSNDHQAELTRLFCEGAAGHAASYNAFLQKIAILLRRMVSKKLPQSDVEDVVQDILISVHKARHTYDGQRPLMPWIFAIARFRINDHLRRLYARASHETDGEGILENFQDDVTKPLGETESVEELLRDVPEKQRHILTMMYVEGFTARETGEKLEMNESAVKVAAHRALKKIREKLKV